MLPGGLLLCSNKEVIIDSIPLYTLKIDFFDLNLLGCTIVMFMLRR